MFWHEFKQAMDKINNMDKIKVGDYVKITGNSQWDLKDGFRDMVFEVLSTEGVWSDLIIDTTKAGGIKYWNVNLKDVEKVNPTNLEYTQEGDIMYYPENKTYSKVLGICGRVLFTTDWYESLKEAQEDIDLDYSSHTIDTYKQYGYIRYVPEEKKEIEELTMEDVCKELGRTIKIKK